MPKPLPSLLVLSLTLAAGWALMAFSQQTVPTAPDPKPLPAAAVSAHYAESGETLHFVAFGDMGSGAPAQREIADRLLSLYQENPYPLVLMLGDIIYPAGDVDRAGKRLITDYYGPLMERGVSFLGVLGNHDTLHHHGDRMVSFLKMPGKYYHRPIGLVDFFALDTNDFDERQAKWLKDGLAQSKAPWRIVFGHHPIWSSGEHGNNAHLLKILAPVLEAGGADLYLAGHDHDYERLTPVAGTLPVISGGGGAALDRKIAPMGVLPIVSGGGGAYLREFARIQPGSRVRVKAHHVLVLDVSAQSLQVRAIAADGHALDCVALKREGDPHQTAQNLSGPTDGCERLSWRKSGSGL